MSLPYFLATPHPFRSFLLGLPRRYPHLPQYEQRCLDNNGHKDESQCQHHGMNELPSQEEVAHVEACDPCHEETKEKGHCIRD